MKTALAAALLALTVSGAEARPVCNDRMCAEVAWGGMARDVVEAIRQKRALVRKSHRPRAHHARRSSKRIHVPLPRPRPMAAPAHLAERPAACPARAWCGCWLAHYLGMPARSLWLAANWRFVGRPAGGPQIGAIVVWRHHVGIITGRHGSRWVVKSGNDGRRVRERPRSIAGAIAYRVRA